MGFEMGCTKCKTFNVYRKETMKNGRLKVEWVCATCKYRTEIGSKEWIKELQEIKT